MATRPAPGHWVATTWLGLGLFPMGAGKGAGPPPPELLPFSLESLSASVPCPMQKPWMACHVPALSPSPPATFLSGLWTPAGTLEGKGVSLSPGQPDALPCPRVPAKPSLNPCPQSPFQAGLGARREEHSDPCAPPCAYRTCLPAGRPISAHSLSRAPGTGSDPQNAAI